MPLQFVDDVPSITCIETHLRKIVRDLTSIDDFPVSQQEADDIITVVIQNQKWLEGFTDIRPDNIPQLYLHMLMENQTLLFNYSMFTDSGTTLGEKNNDILRGNTESQHVMHETYIKQIIQRNYVVPLTTTDVVMKVFEALVKQNPHGQLGSKREMLTTFLTEKKEEMEFLLKFTVLKACLYYNDLGRRLLLRTWFVNKECTLPEIFIKMFLQSMCTDDHAELLNIYIGLAGQIYIYTFNFMESDHTKMHYPCASLPFIHGNVHETFEKFKFYTKDNVGIGQSTVGCDSFDHSTFMRFIKRLYNNSNTAKTETRASGVSLSFAAFDVNCNHTFGVLEDLQANSSFHINYIMDELLLTAGAEETHIEYYQFAFEKMATNKEAQAMLELIFSDEHGYAKVVGEITEEKKVWQSCSVHECDKYKLPHETEKTSHRNVTVYRRNGDIIRKQIAKLAYANKGYYACSLTNMVHNQMEEGPNLNGKRRPICSTPNLCQEVVQTCWKDHGNLCALSSLNLRVFAPLCVTKKEQLAVYNEHLQELTNSHGCRLVQIIDKKGMDSRTNTITEKEYISSQEQGVFAVSIIGDRDIVYNLSVNCDMDHESLFSKMVELREKFVEFARKFFTQEQWRKQLEANVACENTKMYAKLTAGDIERNAPNKFLVQAPASNAAIINGTRGVVPGMCMTMSPNVRISCIAGQGVLFSESSLLLTAARNPNLISAEFKVLKAELCGRETEETTSFVKTLKARRCVFSKQSPEYIDKCYAKLNKQICQSVSTYFIASETPDVITTLELLKRRHELRLVNLVYYADTTHTNVSKDFT